MTPEELEAIRDRAAYDDQTYRSTRMSHRDRAALLAEVDRLRAFILELDGDPFHGLAAQTVLQGDR